MEAAGRCDKNQLLQGAAQQTAGGEPPSSREQWRQGQWEGTPVSKGAVEARAWTHEAHSLGVVPAKISGNGEPY